MDNLLGRDRTRLVGLLLCVGAACAGCAAPHDEWHSVLQLDACGGALPDQPIDLKARALAAGCASSSTGGLGLVELTVESITSPREFVVRGRYGLERVRVAYQPSTACCLNELSAAELGDLGIRLDRALCGQILLEPDSNERPVRSSNGLRMLALYTRDEHRLDELVCEIAERMPRSRDVSPVHAVPPRELASVPQAPKVRRERTREIVELAERYSDWRAPPALSVQWVEPAQVPPVTSNVFDAWRASVGPCFDEDEIDPDSGRDWLGQSFPGDLVYLRSDHDWRELELRFFLLHELMHQQEWALCADGRVPFGCLPDILKQAYASSMALEILRRAGATPEMLQLVRDWDGCASECQAFDDFRSQLGLSPENALLELARHPDEARRMSTGGYLAAMNCPLTGELTFEYAGRSKSGDAIVRVTNTTAQACSIYSDGWWHGMTTSAAGEGMVGGAPFMLRLPPHGVVTLLTQYGGSAPDDLTTCHVVYATTPSPLFEP
jgi:hypothetical protein